MNEPFLNGNGNHGPIDRVADWIKSESSTRALGWLTLTMVAVVVVMAGFTIPRILSNTDASRRTDDLNACRAQYRSVVDDAVHGVFEAFGEVQTGIGKAAVAAIRQDILDLQSSAEFLENAEAEVETALTQLLDASDEHRDAVNRSIDDPEEFLEECREDQR